MLTDALYRSQGDHDFLLHLHGLDHRQPRPRCRGHPSRQLIHLPLFRCHSKWARLCTLHVPAYQWLCRLPAVRRRDNPIRLASPSEFLGHVYRLWSGQLVDVQELGGVGPDEHHRSFRRAVSGQWDLLAYLSDHAGHTSGEYPAGPVAVR